MTLQNKKKPEIAFYTKTKDLWRAMYEDCKRAKKHIYFSQYIIYDDKIGRKFLHLFEQKAREGIKIELVLDPIGSHMIRDVSHLEGIRKAGGNVHFYNDLKWYNIFTPARWFPRNHSKFMSIDDDLFYVGGMCVADYMIDWHDLHARIYAKKEDYGQDFRILDNDGGGRSRTKREIYQTLLSCIKNANESICLVAPYFIPPYGLTKALKKARKRGVKIKVLLSERTDNKIADMAMRTYLKKFHKMDVDIYFYQPSVLHAKYAIFDDKVSTFGSANLDYLSLFRNREVNILVKEQKTVQRIKRIFDEMHSKGRKSSLADWYGLSFTDKMWAYAGKRLRRFL